MTTNCQQIPPPSRLNRPAARQRAHRETASRPPRCALAVMVALTALTALSAVSGCSGMSVQELQSGYVTCADELELRTSEMVALRDEIAGVWEFAIKHDRAQNIQQAVKFLHARDPKERLKKLDAAVEDVRTRLQDLGRYSTDKTHEEWHHDLAEIFAMFERGVTNTRDAAGSSLGSFKAETEKFRVDLMTRLSALSITLKVPTS